VHTASAAPENAQADGDDDDDGKETDHQTEVNNGDTTVGVLTIHPPLDDS